MCLFDLKGNTIFIVAFFQLNETYYTQMILPTHGSFYTSHSGIFVSLYGPIYIILPKFST